MKKGILILARKRIDKIILEAIPELLLKYNVVIVCGSAERENYEGLNKVVVKPDVTIQDAIDYRANHSKEQIRSEARQLEAELGIGSYESNSNYMLYDIFVSRYARVPNSHRLTKEYLVELNILSYKLLKNIYAQWNIKYAYYETIDLPISYLINAMAKKKLLAAYEFRWLPLLDEHRIRIASGLSRRSERIEHIYKNKLYSKETFSDAKKKLDGLLSSNGSFYNTVHTLSLFEKFFGSIKRGFNLRHARAFAKKRLNAKRANKYFSNNLPDENFVAVFLQHTPEASMCSQAPMFVNQHVFIEQLAIYGKAGYTIVVKEHPRSLGNREESFYADLSTFPNVVLLPPDFDNDIIVDRAKAIVSITTTAMVLKSILKNKCVYMFGDTFCDFFEHVIRVNSPSEFWYLLSNFTDEMLDSIKVVEFLAACIEGSYVFPNGTKGFIFPEEGGGRILAKALSDEIRFFEAHGASL